jgi:hypothetical protein
MSDDEITQLENGYKKILKKLKKLKHSSDSESSDSSDSEPEPIPAPVITKKPLKNGPNCDWIKRDGETCNRRVLTDQINGHYRCYQHKKNKS